MKYTLITGNSDICSLLDKWKNNRIPVIALDIEAENNLHQYGERLCLVQVNDGTNIYIIDPFTIKKTHLKNLFENPRILKIMYDASSDLSLLKNAHDMEIKSILDLRPAVEILDYEKKDLHSVIAADMDIRMQKKSKFQRFNWTRRPLPEDVLEYASNDVAHLFELKKAVMDKIITGDLLDEYILMNLTVQTKNYRRSREDSYQKIRGFDRLKGPAKEKVKRIYDLRDIHARELNVPPNDVIPSRALADIASGKTAIADIQFPRKLKDGRRKAIIEELRTIVGAVQINND